MEITHALTLTGILTESRRIIKSKSLLFLLFSISLITFPPNHRNFPSLHHLIYLLLIYTFTLCATSSITYNAHHLFLSYTNNLTTTPLTTLSSITNSLFPLSFTAVVSHALMLLASLAFLMLAGLAFMSVVTLASLFGVEYDSVYVAPFSVVLGVALFVVMMWLYMNWLLVNVVVVTDSKWGFQALVRSWYLLKGMRCVDLKLLLFFGVLEGFFVMVYSGSLFGDDGSGIGRWTSLLNTMLGSYFLMLLLLYSSVANVFLYNYCKAVHGEIVAEEGFVQCDYAGLRDDGDKAPFVVTFVTA